MPRATKTPDRRQARQADTDDALRAEVYVIEGMLSCLLDDIDAWVGDRVPNDPPPRPHGQQACAAFGRTLAKELTERLKVAKAEAKRRGVKPWDEMGIPKEGR
jgi:hypothetical protein